ncbi:MAG: excinuclease ABC subunit UvrA, partial [Gammaproteobacteria bacterium]|nr:excinuclease ABC subunit UvrA [Gammaproteobacteria bacterium]
MRDTINIIGVRTHNLKNIDIKIPRDKLVIITGISGSGKSSLAFDTLYAEGQRRYTESLSSYARQFLSMMDKPDIDYIDGLSPAIAIQQKNVSHNPRSTVGTVTEIHDYLRLLYARAGTAYCPEHNKPLHAQVVSDMTDSLLKNFKDQRIAILAPVIRGRKGEHSGLLQNLQRQGFIRARIDDIDYELDSPPKLDKNLKHNIDAIVDRLKVTPENIQRIAESLENALKLSDGLAKASLHDDPKAKPILFSSKFSCPECDYSIPELEPRIFSFNSPHGACQECQGLGNKRFFDPKRIVHEQLSINEGAIRGWNISSPYYFGMLKDVCDHYEISMDKSFGKLKESEQKTLLYGSGKEKIAFSTFKYSKYHTYEGVIPNFDRRYRDTDSSYIQDELLKFMSISKCTECDGARICKEALHVRIANKNLAWVNQLAIEDSLKFAKEVKITGKQGIVSEKILREVVARLEFLNDVGLGYLSLDRSADTLSGGETQRIRLASQIGSGLVGVLYVLDEPSIGLHQRDNRRLLDTLHKLRDLGNSLIVVEHDQETISDADHIIDIGPGAGIHGGELVAQGSIQDIMAAKDSLTGDYLAGRKEIIVPKTRRAYDKSKSLSIQGASGNNLKDVDVSIPLGLFTCVTGVSGSGKSTLINQTLYPLAAQKLNRATLVDPKAFREIEGLDMLDKVINIDQSPIGRTPRSNPATYIGMFTYI